MSKNELYLAKVVIPYHPNGKEFKPFIKNKLARTIDVSCLFEETLAYHGDYQLVNESYRDFSDNSDAKTSSVRINLAKDRGIAEIGNLQNKIGALRIAISNDITNTVDFFFLSKKEWKNLVYSCGTDANPQRQILKPSWSLKNGYNSFENYRVATFKELAKAK